MIKIYRFLSNRGLGKYIPEKVMFKVQDIIKKVTRKEIKVKVGKYKMSVFKDDNFSFIFRKKREVGLTKLIPEISKEFDLFIDVGSCFGYYIMLSNAKRNVAIEPDDLNHTILLKNIAQNDIINTTVFKVGIADKIEERIFYLTARYGTHTLRKDCIMEHNLLTGTKVIQVTTLDELLKDEIGKKILFKIDIEGLEAEAFKGMKKLIASNNIEIIFEYNFSRYNEEDFKKVNEIVSFFDIIYIDDIYGTWKNITYKEYLYKLDKDFAEGIEKGWCNLYLKKKVRETE